MRRESLGARRGLRVLCRDYLAYRAREAGSHGGVCPKYTLGLPVAPPGRKEQFRKLATRRDARAHLHSVNNVVYVVVVVTTHGQRADTYRAIYHRATSSPSRRRFLLQQLRDERETTKVVTPWQPAMLAANFAGVARRASLISRDWKSESFALKRTRANMTPADEFLSRRKEGRRNVN